MSNPLIKLENVSYKYPNSDLEENNFAVHDVSFEIGKGEFVAILGHNGSGKSTSAKLINMILTADSGKIYIDGKDITDEGISDEDVFEVRKKIGMVFQNPDNQIVATVVEEDVAFGPENLGLPPEEIRKRVDYALETVGMQEYARHAPHKLSGGQKQRIAIAGTIAMKPQCIVFDESTAMLDPQGRKEVMNTIKRLNREEGIAIVLITHYMNEAVQADKVIVMKNGSVYLEGTPNQVFSQPDKLWEAGLEVPQSIELIDKLNKELSLDIPLKVYDLEECTSIIKEKLEA
ncbi:MAG: energy-coupling factor transporter ATPase [Ruminococcaceae bacterium]|nr:energy-coupling factor transporter ATPase [Oscillospiraceae bacterium]